MKLNLFQLMNISCLGNVCSLHFSLLKLYFCSSNWWSLYLFYLLLSCICINIIILNWCILSPVRMPGIQRINPWSNATSLGKLLSHVGCILFCHIWRYSYFISPCLWHAPLTTHPITFCRTGEKIRYWNWHISGVIKEKH